jgi:hypothetical protein
MLYDGIAQQNHVDVMVKRLFLRKPSALLFHLGEMILPAATASFSIFVQKGWTTEIFIGFI